MKTYSLTTPVAFFVFNRPEETKIVFSAIRNARPAQLLIIADGPRLTSLNDKFKCEEVRQIVNLVDWPCEVQHNYSDVNLGCRNRVASGLDWVFNKVEEAIILEDDCLPDISFFRFCQEMLERYRNDSRIASIGGTNYQCCALKTPYSYYFSRYNHIWGWASWKRAWMDYDVEMTKWPTVRDTDWLSNIFTKKIDYYFWVVNFEKAYCGKLDTWDLQWTFACWLNNRLSIIPSLNLVSNIGFGSDATHTKSQNINIANMAIESIKFPIRHPDSVVRNRIADNVTQNSNYRQNLIILIYNIIKFHLLRSK